MYECHSYLTRNGYVLKRYGHEEVATDIWESIDEFKKDFGEYTITVSSHVNFYGGKEVIEVQINDWKDENENMCGVAVKPHHHMRPPSISFFATGYHDYEAMEKMVKEEIAPALKKWAIEVL